MEEIFLDASGSILGRIASFVAKLALQENDVVILNCEKAVISGKKKSIIEHYRKKFFRKKGTTIPSITKTPVGIMRRAIRGMLPWKKARGREAFKKIKCFQGMPAEYEGKELKSIEKKEIEGITLKEICRIF